VVEVLNNEEKQRYSRHFLVEEIGETGQEKLKASRVLVVGTGGLGSPVLYYLAAAGIGTLGFLDSDVVDISNLQRQILHSTRDIGRPKVKSAAEKLETLNPEIELIPFYTRLEKGNAEEIFSDFDIIVDATDNFSTRYVINDVCVKTQKPFIHGGIMKLFGQLTTIIPGRTPCLRCVFGSQNDTEKKPFGVIGTIAGIIGALQATEVIKLIVGKGGLLTGQLLTVSLLNMDFNKIIIEKNAECPVCGNLSDGYRC
jgi:adenylyltransferase/sulfurtransferase